MITIIGPTASGKTKLAALLASHIGGIIFSGDSRQVYRGMDIGTGKDLVDYQVGDIQIPYRLIDICDIGEHYNIYRYQRDFHEALGQIRAEASYQPILCGGSGLYIESVLRGYQLPDVPENPTLRTQLSCKSIEELSECLRAYGPLHNITDLDSPQRAIRAIEIADYKSRQSEFALREEYPPVESTIILIDISREVRRGRISSRLERRVSEGLIPEIERLLARGVSPDQLIYYGLEYKYVTEHVIGLRKKQEMLAELEIAIHQFAKRQMTWFRGMERRGLKLHRIDGEQPLSQQLDDILTIIRSKENDRL